MNEPYDEESLKHQEPIFPISQWQSPHEDIRRNDDYEVFQFKEYPCVECGKFGLGIPNAIYPICGGE